MEKQAYDRRENKKYKYSYDHSHGYYVGFKLILATNLDSQILGFEIHENLPHDSKLLISFVQKLIRSRMIEPGDILICDEGLSQEKHQYR
jgi:hypothetical protein